MTHNPSLADVVARREEVAREIKVLIAKMDKLREEEARLHAAIDVLQSLRSSAYDAAETARIAEAVFDSPPPPPRKETFFEQIEKIMRNSARVWWTAAEIRKELSALRGEDIPQGNVSPKLTKLKEDGLIVRNGMNIALKDRAPPEFDLDGRNENEPAAEGSDADAGDVTTSPASNPSTSANPA